MMSEESVPSVAIAGTGDYQPGLSSDKGVIIIFLSAFKPLRLLRGYALFGQLGHIARSPFIMQ
jgi:hypothetical protein